MTKKPRYNPEKVRRWLRAHGFTKCPKGAFVSSSGRPYWENWEHLTHGLTMGFQKLDVLDPTESQPFWIDRRNYDGDFTLQRQKSFAAFKVAVVTILLTSDAEV